MCFAPTVIKILWRDSCSQEQHDTHRLNSDLDFKSNTWRSSFARLIETFTLSEYNNRGGPFCRFRTWNSFPLLHQRRLIHTISSIVSGNHSLWYASWINFSKNAFYRRNEKITINDHLGIIGIEKKKKKTKIKKLLDSDYHTYYLYMICTAYTSSLISLVFSY